MKSVVAIRQIAKADQKPFVAAVRASTGFHRGRVSPPRDSRAFQRYLKRFDGKASFGFLVYLPDSCEIVGAINLTNIIFGNFRSGYLGYFAFADFEGRGFMKQGLKAVVCYAFTALKLHRLEANIQSGNTASIALVKGCGFHKEGYSPAYLKIGGRWRDHERWAIVRGIKYYS